MCDDDNDPFSTDELQAYITFCTVVLSMLEEANLPAAKLLISIIKGDISTEGEEYQNLCELICSEFSTVAFDLMQDKNFALKIKSTVDDAKAFREKLAADRAGLS